MSGLESRIAGLSPLKRDLLLQRLRQQQEPRAELLSPRFAQGRDDELHQPFPMTGIQQAYWAGRSGLFDLGTQGANGYFELHFTGLDEAGLARLSSAFRALVERHPMLRAVVLADGRQRILERVPPFEIQVNDLRGMPGEEAERRIAALREDLRTRRSPLDRWPLFDFVASQLADGGVRLQMRFELVVLDGVTRLLLFREWFQLFRDPGAELPPLECTYRDFVQTWTDFRAGEGFRRSREYWLEQLPRMRPAPEVPLARNVDPGTPSRFVNHAVQTLDGEAWARLRGRASTRGLTPTTLVLAAFVDVLRAWSRNPDFSFPVLGTFNPPIHPQIDQIVGNFNSLTMLTVDGWEGSFEDRARRLQDQVTAALDHSYFPGFEVLREINRRRAPTSKVPMPILFDSLLELGHRRYGYLDSGSLGEGIRYGYVDHAGMYVPNFQIVAMVAQFGPALFSRWQFVEEIYPAGLVEQMADAYAYLLQRLEDDEEAWQARWNETVRMLFARPGAGPLARWDPGEEPAAEEVVARLPERLRAATGGARLGLRVLNAASEPCPVWVPGEICLVEPGGTLLRTGEEGRLLPTGELEWLGRRETEEATVLGYPVVLREVAACLERHPEVSAAAVAADGEGRLAAWVVRSSRSEIQPGDLLDFLDRRLPYYMVPSALLFVEALPRTADGDVDLAALPSPPRPERAGEDGLDPALLGIWREALGVEAAGPDDDIYAAGGDSLALARLAVRVRERFGEDLPLWKLFRNPTVRGLADLIRNHRSQADSQGGGS